MRAAAARKFERENGLQYDPQQIIVSCGGKHSCYNVMLACCQEGDEVIIPAPYWLSYPEMVKLAGATPVIVETTDATEFKLTPDQLRDSISDRTRVFILNSPSNPTGSIYTPEEIRALGDVCVEKGVLIMSDDIYEKLIYGNTKFQSVAACSPEHQAHTIIVHGLAKAYSMTGWRIGFIVGNELVVKGFSAVKDNIDSGQFAAIQKAADYALSHPEITNQIAAKYKRRLKLLVNTLNSVGFNASMPGGTFFLYVN